MLFAIFYKAIQKSLDLRIGLEIFFDIGCCLFSGDTQILAQSERTDSIYDSEVYSFGISSLQRCNLIKRHMEHLGCCKAVDILCLSVCLDQFLISGHVSQHTKLDLGIIGIQEHISILRHKNFADQSSKFHTYRNILKIRLCAADTAGSSDRLVKSGVDSSVFSDHISKPVCISRFQFGKLAVFQDIFHDLMIRCQFIQDICCCGVACLGLLSTWKSHFFKKDHSKLFGGINVKLLSRFLPDQLLKLLNTNTQLLTVTFQFLSPDKNPPFFHGIQCKYQRKLDLVINLSHTCFIQLLKKDFSYHIRHKSLITGQITQTFHLILPGFLEGYFSEKIFFCRKHYSIQIFSGNIIVGIGRLQWIQKICCNSCIKNLCRFSKCHMFQHCLDIHGTDHCMLTQSSNFPAEIIACEKTSHRNLINLFFIKDKSHCVYLICVCKDGNSHLFLIRCFFKQSFHT